MKRRETVLPCHLALLPYLSGCLLPFTAFCFSAFTFTSHGGLRRRPTPALSRRCRCRRRRRRLLQHWPTVSPPRLHPPPTSVLLRAGPLFFLRFLTRLLAYSQPIFVFLRRIMLQFSYNFFFAAFLLLLVSNANG